MRYQFFLQYYPIFMRFCEFNIKMVIRLTLPKNYYSITRLPSTSANLKKNVKVGMQFSKSRIIINTVCIDA